MNAKRVLVLSAVLLLLVVVKGLALPTPDEVSPYAAADVQILAEIRDHSEAAQNLARHNSKPQTTGPPKPSANTASPTFTSNPGKLRIPGRGVRQKPASSRPPSFH